MVKTSGVTEKLRTENANPEHEHGTGNVELGLQLSSRFRVPGSWFRSAKGGTRTHTPFRVPDPKSGASASSATFASNAAYSGFPMCERARGHRDSLGRYAVCRRRAGRAGNIFGRTCASDGRLFVTISS